ncbi:MAG: hypothetical protein CXZ00_14155 [Acidobacteria bacterium]|nr:MAG: hypothetical protein CXZ00_14155 [Acidobacteriota bacterium]
MSSSSEPTQSAPQAFYAPLEYREADEPIEPDPSPQPSPEASSTEPPAPSIAEPQPDPAALFAARLEEERRAIVEQAQQETEREIQRARGEIARTIEHFAQQRDEYFRQAEAEVVNLALAIARRLIHREAQVDHHLLAGLVNYELGQLDAATDVRLFVSPDALDYWNEAANTLPRSVEVKADKSLAPGESRIETGLGSTTVSVERGLKEIERGFFDLLSRRPVITETKPVSVQ